MASSVPAGQWAAFHATVANNVWPGPPEWTSTAPDSVIISLVDGGGQFDAYVLCAVETQPGAPLQIQITCGLISGFEDVDVLATGNPSASPIEIVVK